jgi:cytochrome c biogenesis protein CcdA
MLRLTALVVSIGLADSLNPTTIGPALYLAAGKRARGEVAEFTMAVFVVYLAGGLLIALGPGQLLLSLVPRPDAEDRYVLEVIAGGVMIAVAAFLWSYRHRLANREAASFNPDGRSSALLGAVITAIELPTAFPYFAAIAAIVGSGLDVTRQALLLLLFNICFVLPLVGIVVALTLAGDTAKRHLASARRWLELRWPIVLAGLLLVAGAFVTLLGVTGFGGLKHGSLPRFLRRVHKLLHP